MWTMSNSRAERSLRRLALLAALPALAACRSSQNAAPDAPRPARDPSVYPAYEPQQPAPGQGPVELRSVRVSAVRGDTLLQRLAPPALRDSRTAFAVDVTTAEPLGNTAVSSAPQIFLNGVRPAETAVFQPDRLILILPGAQNLRGPVQVTVEWMGRGERTRTTRPLTISEEQLSPSR